VPELAAPCVDWCYAPCGDIWFAASPLVAKAVWLVIVLAVPIAAIVIPAIATATSTLFHSFCKNTSLI
jgi:hypothetical protein